MVCVVMQLYTGLVVRCQAHSVGMEQCSNYNRGQCICIALMSICVNLQFL